VGATLKEFQALFAPRVAELEEQFIGPLDELNDAVAQAERELELLRQRQLATTTAIWSRYKAGYERYLQPPDDAAEVDPAEVDPAEVDPAEVDPAEVDPADHTATAGEPSDGAANGDDGAGAADATLDGQNSEETP
jgi:hypothetical protein